MTTTPNVPNPVSFRTELLDTRGWTLEHVFDTNEHEPLKDVALIRTAEGAQRVLRIGERRPPGVFPRGYHGHYVVFPEIFESTPGRVAFEVEEYLPGTLLADLEPQPTGAEIVRNDLLERLIEGCWEVMFMLRHELLVAQWRREEKLDKHLHSAHALLTEEERRHIACVLAQHEEFWDPLHTQPAKWKYTLDNIILMPDGRLGLVDLARVGLYPWGYDLGWIVWPRWFSLPLDAWRHPQGHLAALNRFVEAIMRSAPSRERESHTLSQRVHLVLLERVIGAFYDIATPTPHARRIAEDPEQREAFLAFLHAVLAWTLDGTT